MTKTLRELSVSCVTAADDIFKPSRQKRSRGQSESSNSEDFGFSDTETAVTEKKEPDLTKLDKAVASIYERIPLNESCSVDSLVGADADIRDVMKALLTLEMRGYVVSLPGERVKRA